MSSAEKARSIGTGGEGEGDNPGNRTAMVTFPRGNRGWGLSEPLKIELEDDYAENTNPSNMWQVYALGGFMIARWLWAKYKTRINEGNDDDPSG